MVVALLLCCICLPLAARPIPPREQLQTAIDIYEHGGYLEAAARLNKILYPLKLSEPEDIVRAKVYLGLCYYVLGKKDDAEQEFRGVFKLDPDYRPDPLYIPAEIIEFIEQLRPPPPQTPRRTDVLGLGETLEAPPSGSFRFHAPNLLPLGIPQFRAGDTRKGLALLIGEISLLSLNISSYYYLKVFNDPHGVPPERYPSLLAAKATNITTLSLLAITMLYGAGDALYRYPPAPSEDEVGVGFIPGRHGLLMVTWRRRF